MQRFLAFAWGILALGALALLASPELGGAGRLAGDGRLAEARYTVEIEFHATWTMAGQGPGGRAWRVESATAWLGKSSPFTLINRGSSTRPILRIRPPVGGYPIAVGGYLDHVGYGTLTVRALDCRELVRVRESTQGARVQARFLLDGKRLRVWMSGSGTVTLEQVDAGCGFPPGRIWTMPFQTKLPRDDPDGNAWWRRHGQLRTGELKTIGRALSAHRTFTLVRHRDPLSDPSLREPIVDPQGGAGEQQWTFSWKLVFRSASRR